MFSALILASALTLPSLQARPPAQARPTEPPLAPQVADSFVGSQRPGRLGVTLQDSNGGSSHGIQVAAVDHGSPADSAGVAPGDRIVEADGKEVSRSSDLVNRIRAIGADHTISLIVERDVEVTIENVPLPNGESGPRIGLEPVTGDDGILRTDQVPTGLPADRAGVQAGDRLLAFDGQSISDGDALRSLVRAKQAGQKVTLRIGRELHAKLSGANETQSAPRAGAAPNNPGPDLFAPAPPSAPRSVNPPRAQRFANPPVAPRAQILRQGNDDMHAALADLRRELDALRRDINDLKREIQTLRRERSEGR